MSAPSDWPIPDVFVLDMPGERLENTTDLLPPCFWIVTLVSCERMLGDDDRGVATGMSRVPYGCGCHADRQRRL